MSDQTRAAIYAVLAAITPLIVAYGLLTESNAALWVALIKAAIDMAALLLARANVPAAGSNPEARRAAVES